MRCFWLGAVILISTAFLHGCGESNTGSWELESEGCLENTQNTQLTIGTSCHDQA